MARKAFASANFFPVLLAVTATGSIGWWLKRQEETSLRDPLPLPLRLDQLPKVSVSLQRTGTGPLPNKAWRPVPDTALWAWLEFRDNNVPREKHEGRVLGVFTD